MIEPNPLTIMAGEWKQVTFHAGELTWPQLVTYTYSGTLSLISSRYTMSTLVETSDTDGSNADQESLDDDGSYSLNGSVMTFTSDDNEDQISQSDEANLRVTARQLALAFPEITLVFDKMK